MAEQERPLVDRVWEFTKDLSVKVSRKAEKHWKINTLRVEIASIKHRINVKYKDLGRYVYESLKSGTLEEESYKASVGEFFDELARLEGEIVDREHRIEILEQEMSEEPGGAPVGETPPEPPAPEPPAAEAPAPEPPADKAETPEPPSEPVSVPEPPTIPDTPKETEASSDEDAKDGADDDKKKEGE